MSKKKYKDLECDSFKTRRIEHVAIIHFKEHVLFNATDLCSRDKAMDYLDCISEDDSIKVLLIVSSPEKNAEKDYFDFYGQLLRSDSNLTLFYRLCNVVNQFILKIVGLNKFVIHANTGDVISLFFNMSLACDYRIICENTVFHNPYMDLGLLPKGGGPFFLFRLLDSWKVYELLLFKREISTHEALELGLIDKVVSAGELEKTAIEFARNFKNVPLRTLSGIKKLKNYSMHDLYQYLELEDLEIRKIVEHEFWA